jgi:hypothetical protein
MKKKTATTTPTKTTKPPEDLEALLRGRQEQLRAALPEDHRGVTVHGGFQIKPNWWPAIYAAIAACAVGVLIGYLLK